MRRLFTAIDFPETVRKHLTLLQSGLPDARWMPEEQLHLTLRFIGEVDGTAFADIRETLRTVRYEPFPLSLNGVGHFPPRGKPTVLWAGITGRDHLEHLRQRVDTALSQAGIPPEGRKFSPHVTVARLKGTPPRRVAGWLAHHAGFATPAFPVEAFHLYASTLTQKGAIHQVTDSYTL